MRLGPLARSLLACLLAACTVEQEQVPVWAAVGPEALSEVQQRQLARAIQARDALFSALGGRLQAALEQGTPAEAITVCREAAPRIAAEVSSAQGVAIGRTSQRLRNPQNTPPAWAAAYVASAADQRACFAGPAGELGVLLPIRTLGLCTSCHGPSEVLDPEVVASLAADYPQDRATGYGVDQLRGWFWVEVDP